MANDRLYLRCRQCGERLLLSKHFCRPWAIMNDIDTINDFLDEHGWKHGDKHIPWNSFDLVSEMGEGFPEDTSPVLMHSYDYEGRTYDETKKSQETLLELETHISDKIKQLEGDHNEKF